MWFKVLDINREKNSLKVECHSVEGKGGITEAVIRQTEEALTARELIKGRVLEASLLTAREACEQLAEATGAEGIQTVGSRFVLYRPDPKEPKYVLPKA